MALSLLPEGLGDELMFKSNLVYYFLVHVIFRFQKAVGALLKRCLVTTLAPPTVCTLLYLSSNLLICPTPAVHYSLSRLPCSANHFDIMYHGDSRIWKREILDANQLPFILFALTLLYWSSDEKAHETRNLGAIVILNLK